MSHGRGDGCRSRAPGGRCIRHAEATPRAVDPLAVPVIEPAFQAALMRGGRAPSLVPLRGRAAARPTVGLPPVAGPAEGEHRPAPRPAAPHRAPQPGSGAHAGARHRRRRGGTGERRPTARRERTAARVPVGCDHAYTDPGVLAIARARDHRDERLSVGKSRRARAWRQATATPGASGVTASPPGERRLATLRRGWHARAPRQDPRAGGRQPQREEQLPEQRERRHRFGLRFRFGLGFGHLHAD